MPEIRSIKKSGTFAVLNDTFRDYRAYVVILTILGFIGAGLDGIGINAIVPLLSFLLGNGVPTDPISHGIQVLFGFFGIPFLFRYLLGFVTLLFIGRAAAVGISTYIRGTIESRFMSKEMGMLFRGTMHASWPSILKQKAGYLQNTIFWDVKRTTNLLDSLVQFIQSSTGALMYFIVALNISTGVTLITLMIGAITVSLLRRPLLGRARLFGEEASTVEKLLAQHIGEYLQGFKTVKALDAVSGVIRESGRYLERQRDVYAKSIFVIGLGSVVIQPLSFFFIIAIFWFSYHSGSFNLVAFAATLYLIQKIFTYLDSAQSSFGGLTLLVPYAENITAYKRKLAGELENEAETGASFDFKDAIELKDISFSYDAGRSVLSHISASIPKGSMVGIIGGSGGGKTSLADLLMRLFEPTEGALLLDGVSASSIKMHEWRRRVGYVSQEAFLVHASVMDNIRFFDESVTDADIREAATQAHIYDEIMRLPHGFDTLLGDRGVTLSGGQRQRIALARTLARKPQVLVLDEVTSSLDSELEREIRRVIDELHGDITLVVIAHRVSTVSGADQIWVLKDGSIIERGSPADMLKNPESYFSRMIAMQGSGQH